MVPRLATSARAISYPAQPVAQGKSFDDLGYVPLRGAILKQRKKAVEDRL